MLLLAIPATTHAGTVSRNAPSPYYLTLRYDGAVGEENRVELSRTGAQVLISDAGAPVTLAEGTDGCTQISSSAVSCAKGIHDQVNVFLGDGDDTVVVQGAATVSEPSAALLSGGPGNDTLSGGDANEYLEGEDGNDRIDGGGGFDSPRGGSGDDVLRGGVGDEGVDGGDGDDVLRGGVGDDYLTGGAGRDDIGGGPGQDLAAYRVRRRDPPVTVSLDGRPNDGPANTRELVRRDVEGVDVIAARGGNGLFGNSRPNHLTLSGPKAGNMIIGGAGGDTINASAARAFGGKGNDRIGGSGELYAGPGSDTISGSGTVRAGPGDDVMFPGGGSFFGGRGDDRFTKPESEGTPNDRTRLYGQAGNDTFKTTDLFCPVEMDGRTLERPPSFRCALGVERVAIPDRVSCGAGSDTATVGARDAARPDCERVTRSR